VERDLVVELEGDDLADAVVGLELGQPAELGDAMREVDDEVALGPGSGLAKENRRPGLCGRR